MSNVLKITTSTVGYDNPNLPPKTNIASRPDSSIQGPVVPDKVVRPDARSDSSSQNPDVVAKFKFQSNFEGFITQMKADGSAVENFASAMFERLANLSSSGLSQDALEQIQQFIKMIEVEPQNMTMMLKEQVDSSLIFQGAFFDLLRQVMKESRSVDLQGGILEFLKRFTDMSEGEHLQNQMKQVMENLKAGMFKNGREQLETMEKQLNFSGARADTARNASVLKEKILPFLNQYITNTNDRGQVRENAAFLASLTARYENGQEERVMEKFRELMEYPAMNQKFKGMKAEDVLHLLSMTDYKKSVEKNRWMKEFSAIIREGALKGADPEQKYAFRNAMFSTVLNESVYMPVLHTLIPMKSGDRLMLAEMWVDPDAEGDGGAGRESKRTIRGLIKFDIDQVGFFDLFFIYQDGKIRVQLNYPEDLLDDGARIESEIQDIFTRNGIKAEELYFGTSHKAIPVEEAFPKIFERKNSINVKI